MNSVLDHWPLDKCPFRCHFHNMSASKLEQLSDRLRSYGSCVVAYSGGVDSAFLALVASRVLGRRALAVIADSPSLPRRELRSALALAERFHVQVRVVRTKEFENPDYLANPANRCYFCKHELFEVLVPIARDEGFAVIAYGENASDAGDFRPGARAAEQFQVRAPLKEVGLTKAEIRELSAQQGLPTADKPQMACLSSRIPHGESVTAEKLLMVEAAENALKDLGFYNVRVRHHELSADSRSQSGEAKLAETAAPVRRSNGSMHLARIEVGLAEIPKLFEGEKFLQVAETLRRIGYAYVTLDLLGYRRGGLANGAK
jgi:pyridinium-3,5-biscarboxylic acid mononucleotide sulfurtransferase